MFTSAVSLIAAALLLGAVACGSTALPAGGISASTHPYSGTGPADCPGGSVTFTQHPGDDRARSLCVRRGATLTITLLPARGFRWAEARSSDPSVATVTETHVDEDATGHAVVHAQAAGTASVTSSDSYTPDPFGPPTRLWTLQLQVR